jgi:hypothetical protein
MSNDRLQDYFSELHEGTLDEALAQQVRYRLENDPELNSQYQRFVSTIDSLNLLPNEEVSIPSNLSTLIADRISDAAVNKPTWTLFGFLKPALAMGAIAVLAVGTYTAMKGQQGKTVNASMVGSLSNSIDLLDEVRVDQVRDSFVLRYNSSGPKTLTISSYETKQVLKKYDLDGDAVVLPLENKQSASSAFAITTSGETNQQYVILPGRESTTELKGSGTLVDFTKVLANQFRCSIHLKANQNERLSWDITEKSPAEAASAILGAKRYKLSLKGKSLLEIEAPN